MSATFTAAYDGRCDNCGEYFPAGTLVGYEGGGLIAVSCCGETDDPPAERGATGRKAIEVMPRGKKPSDRCEGCFQIPATNGACGCI